MSKLSWLLFSAKCLGQDKHRKREQLWTSVAQITIHSSNSAKFCGNVEIPRQRANSEAWLEILRPVENIGLNDKHHYHCCVLCAWNVMWCLVCVCSVRHQTSWLQQSMFMKLLTQTCTRCCQHCTTGLAWSFFAHVHHSLVSVTYLSNSNKSGQIFLSSLW